VYDTRCIDNRVDVESSVKSVGSKKAFHLPTPSTSSYNFTFYQSYQHTMAYPPPPKALFVPVNQDDDLVFNRESCYRTNYVLIGRKSKDD
jgi:hypothetical protein